MTIKILIVDDQEVVRKGLVSLLAYQKDLLVIGQSAHGEEAVACARDFNPDVVLMDIRMPVLNGIEATRRIKAEKGSIKVLVLTTFDDDEMIVDALKAGASGYLLKDTPSDQIASAIRTVFGGNTLLGPVAAVRVVEKLLSSPGSTGRELDLARLLTNREMEVLRLIGEGKNNQEIAALLDITEGTVKNHVSRIFAQIGARDRIQAALIAQKELIQS